MGRAEVTWTHAVLDLPAGTDAEVAFWADALGARPGSPWPRHPDLSSLDPGDGDPVLHVQQVTGPPRVHVDLDVADVAAEVVRLRHRGAALVGEQNGWTTLRSPGGLPFCLAAGRPRRRAPARRWPSGATSRLVQVCLDCPADLADDEARFWADTTGWGWRPSGSPEFVGHLVPAAGSLQLLVQRRGSDDPSPAVTAHLDLGADDLEAEAGRLVALGARREWSGDGWITLRDPAGLLFCVTGQSPEAP